MIREEYLVKLNNKNRVQQVLLQLDSSIDQKIYYIYRTTSQFGGKQTQQPTIIITEGKVKRTIPEQAGLQYASYLKSYLDSGYKKLSSLSQLPYKTLTEEDIKKLIGVTTTDTNGIPKPMLAKSYSDLSSDVFEREHYCSRKLDGVRAVFYFKDGEIHTASRGGGTYDVAAQHLRNNPILIEIFKKHPNLMLDGELYKHGWPLQKISGICRLQERTAESDELEYWVYDYISDQTFRDRYTFLMNIQKLFPEDSKVKVIDHYKLSGWLTVKKCHDKFVQEGFEGLCARNPDKEYGIGKRSGNYLIKLKDYQDAEFEIVGTKTGLRPEDMCFILKTSEGKEFAAKPACDAQTRIYYLNHSQEFIGKKATCKFFYYSSDRVPLQPVMKSIRPDDE